MKQGELLKLYSEFKKLNVSRMGRDLDMNRPNLYGLFKSDKFKESTYQTIIKTYPDFVQFSDSILTKELNNQKDSLIQQGYNPNPPALNNSGQTVLNKVTVGNSYASLELLCRVVAHLEKRPLDEVKKEAETIARERLRIVEDMLFGLISS